MKRNILFVIVLLLAIQHQAQDILWEKTLGGKHAEFLNDAIATPDYGFIVAGSSLSKKAGTTSKTNNGDFDYFIGKIDEHGQLEWSKTYGGAKTDRLQSIYKTYDGGYLLAGTSKSGISGDKTTENIGLSDIWLIKLDINTEIEWQKTLGGIGDDLAVVVLNTQDGGYLIGGSSSSDATKHNDQLINQEVVYKSERSRGNLDYWLVKLKIDGKLEWQKTFGGKYVDELRSVVELPEGGFVIGGVSNSPICKDKDADSKGYNDWWIMQLDKDGNQNWQTNYGTAGDDQLYSIVLTGDNAILVGGNMGEVSKKGNSSADFLLLKLDLDGKQIWKKTFDVGNIDIMTNVVENKDGTFLLSGYVTKGDKKSIGKGDGIEDYIALKINKDGAHSWTKTVGSNKKEVLRHSIETRDGGYVLLGTQIKKSGKKDSNFWIVKLKDEDKEEHIKELIEAMPNPAQEYTTIVLGYDYKDGTVSVIDIAGRLIQQFEIEGNRMIPVNTRNLPFGVYIVHVKTDVQEDNIKILKGVEK